MAKEKEVSDRIASLEQENAILRDRFANIEKMLAMQAPVTTAIVREAEREAEYERKKAELGKSCQERTQIEARRRWTDASVEYPVKVADVPEIFIPARGPEEAKGRFDALCGILGVDQKHKYVIGAPVAAPCAA